MIETKRLILREWQDSDLAPFARLNSDSRAMEFMPKLLTREESDDWVNRMRAHMVTYGFAHYAAVLKEGGIFIGAIGLSVPSWKAHFSPFIEIGWRILPEYWNQGFATEGAKAVLDHASEQLKLAEIVAFTVPTNLPSLRVMRKIGMVRDPAGDFDHPRVPVGHHLQRHVLYRWRKSAVK